MFTVLEILLGLCLIFLLLIFVLFLYCAIAINSIESESDDE